MVHRDITNYQSVKLKALFIMLEGICEVSTTSIFLHRIMMTMKIMHFGLMEMFSKLSSARLHKTTKIYGVLSTKVALRNRDEILWYG